MNKLFVTESAKNDIRNALAYIQNNLCNSQASSSLAEEITKQLSILKLHPNTGPLVEDSVLSDLGIRFLLVKNYKAYYKIEESENETIVYIIRFLHSRQNYETILGE